MNKYMITRDQQDTIVKELDIHNILFITNDDYFKNSMVIFSKRGQKSIPLPKNLDNITVEWVSDKISSYLNNPTKNLRPVFQKLGLRGNIYYTSFGFSYDCFMKNKDTFDTETQLLKDTLTNMNIAYTNEFSDAYWVYRFRVSQSKDNSARI